MALKYAIEDLASELAFIAQVTNGVIKQVYGIKKKAENAQAAGYTDATAKLDDAFFLSRELWDLDSTPYLANANSYLDTVVTKFKDLHAYVFGNASPTIIGPYYRNWPGAPAANTDYTVKAVALTNLVVSTTTPGALVLSGYTVLNNDRILLTGQLTTSENGVYTAAITGTPNYTLTRVTAGDVQNSTFHVVDGTSHLYKNTAWWNYGTILKPRFAQMLEFDLPVSLSGDALYAARSHKIYGENYYQTVKDISTIVGTLKTAITNFISAVTTLKGSTTLATTIANAATVITHKQTIDSTILSFDGEILNAERIATHFNPWIPWDNSLWTEDDRRNQIMAGHIYKPHKMVSPPTEFTALEKTYNNNFTKSQGDSSGGTSTAGSSMTGSTGGADIVQALHNMNALYEYWAQIGWMTSERTNNYRIYLEHLERDMVEKGLEEILEMHDKAVLDTYSKEQGLPPGFLTPFSPKPIIKSKRAIPDLTLPYTEDELRALGLIP